MRLKTVTMSLLAALCVVGTISCSKDVNPNPEPEVKEFGSLKLSVDFAKVATKATVSTAKPTTTWENINNLMILFVDQNEIVKAAQEIAVPTATDDSDQPMVINAIPVGTYTTYLVANHNDDSIKRNTTGEWNQSNVVGMNINTLTLSLIEHTQFTATADPSGSTAYTSPAEVFIAQMPTTIEKDATTSKVDFDLNRMVSILRVRINQANDGNDVVNFGDAAAELRIRRANTSATLNNGVSTTTSSLNLMYDKGDALYKSSEPTEGYTSGTILDSANGYTLWSDMLIFPGGSETNGDNKFDLVLSAMAPVGYVPYGQTAALSEPTMVYWSGQVGSSVSANSILEVNCTLHKAGTTTLPEALDYGNLDLNLSIMPWCSITSTDVTM